MQNSIQSRKSDMSGPAKTCPGGPIRAHKGPYGPICAHLGPIWAQYGFIWGLYGPIWFLFGSKIPETIREKNIKNSPMNPFVGALPISPALDPFCAHPGSVKSMNIEDGLRRDPIWSQSVPFPLFAKPRNFEISSSKSSSLKKCAEASSVEITVSEFGFTSSFTYSSRLPCRVK